MSELKVAKRTERNGEVLLNQRRFTVDEYYRMAEVGILHEDDRVELIDGEILLMCPIGLKHANCVAFLVERFITLLGGRAIIWPQNPLRLNSGSEPEPDIVLLRPPRQRYAKAHPGPADVLLLIEVADTSFAYDRDVKLPRYAAAGIPEAWIVDLPRRRVLVYREPKDGRYQDAEIVGRTGTLTPQAFPELSLSVAELLS
ncbi:MAG: Uma2 family endonuclease [Dehalococcoidia bacterium]